MGMHPMKVIAAKNPRYLNAEGTAIGIEVKLDHLVAQGYDFVPFCARPSDVEEHGRALYELAKGGHYGEVAPFVPA